MRRSLYLFFLVTLLSASEVGMLKLRIIENLALLLGGKPVPTVYIDPGIAFPLHEVQTKIVTTSRCFDADIVFVEDIDTLPSRCVEKKRVFTLSYRDYLEHKKEAIGAFFWQKGRPNIIINGDLTERMGIKIPKAYRKYVE